MPSDPKLPGLERLIEVCQRHSLRLKLPPPLAAAPRQGESILGEPVDPQLAAIYSRLGDATFCDVALYAANSEEGGLISVNEWLRQYGYVQFRSSLAFGWRPGFAYYYGTVPKLASTTGLQPVVYISAMEELFALPIASSVDRFFYLYSRYLELMVVDPEYVASGIPDVQFPWSMARFVAQDEPLIQQVREGRFDLLSDNYRGALEWLQELRDGRP
jgi:hypothetical protein